MNDQPANQPGNSKLLKACVFFLWLAVIFGTLTGALYLGANRTAACIIALAAGAVMYAAYAQYMNRRSKRP